MPSVRHVIDLLVTSWQMEQVLSARDNFSSYYQYLESINKLQPYIPLQSLPLK